MKHLYPYFAAMVMLFAVGCGKDNPESDNPNGGGNGKPETVYTISINPGSITVPAEGDTYSAVVSSSANWTLSGGVSWCEPSKTSGSNGETVTFTVEPNTTVSERNVTYTFRCGDKTTKLTITQKQKDALTVTQSKYEVKAEGDDIEIEIKANIPFDYEIAPDCRDWIIPLQTRSMTTSTLIFRITKNPDTERREGSIVIQSGDLSETISVYQAGAIPTIVISQNQYIVSDKGETIKIEVNSNVEYTVEMPDVDWISESNNYSISTHTHYYTILPNETTNDRSAQIIYTNKENSIRQAVTIIQKQKGVLVLLEESSLFGSEGGTLKAGLQHNVEFDVKIAENSQSWIHQTTSRTMESDYLYFTIDPITDNDSREGSIMFCSKDGLITQTHTVYQGPQGDEIITIPDIYLLNYCLSHFDTNKDGKISISEANQVEKIDVYNNISKIILMDGIEYFTNLKELDLAGHSIRDLDLSANTNLERLNISHNQLRTLILPPSIKYLDCSSNTNLTEVNFSQCKELQTLNLAVCGLTSLDISGCPNLETLNCNSNKFTMLDTRQNHNLVSLDCERNQNLKSLKTQNPILKTINCSNCQLSELDVSQNPALEKLQCSYNALLTKLLINNTMLKSLYCSYCSLTNLDVSSSAALTHLSCIGNELTELDVSHNTKLYSLSCEQNKLTSLNVKNNSALSSLNCTNNQITSLDVSGLTRLSSLVWEYNPIETLNISNTRICVEGYTINLFTTPKFHLIADDLIALEINNNDDEGSSLEHLYLQTPRLEELTIESTHALTDLDITTLSELRALTIKAKLTALNVTHNSKLEKLSCGGNQLTTLDISANPALTSLSCRVNNLTELDVSANPALASLDCSDNKLTELDVSANPALASLDCSDNKLTELDVSHNFELEYLDCGGTSGFETNLITEIDLSNNQKLKELYCGNSYSDTSTWPIQVKYPLKTIDVSKCPLLQRISAKVADPIIFKNNKKLVSLEVFTNSTSLDVSECADNIIVLLCINSDNKITIYKNIRQTISYSSDNCIIINK